MESQPTYLRYVQIAGSVMFFVFYMIPGDYPQNNTVFNSFEAQIVYYAVTLVIGSSTSNATHPNLNLHL